MAKVKIISNPYLREISFKRWIEDDAIWQEITLANRPDSKLVRDDIRTGFFPFIVKTIVDTVLSEYSDDNIMTIEFEGTADEYSELKDVCAEKEYAGRIELVKGELYLENARDILPGIRDIYKKIEPLIKISVVNEKEKLEREIVKFVDASGDQIPICVVGNYSTGKSSFINALIGYEILPSGDEPVTGKIYRISNSKEESKASVTYSRSGKEVTVCFDNGDFKLTTDLSDSDLEKQIRHDLEMNEGKLIQASVLSVLENLEKYIREKGNQVIDDLIDVSICFGKGLWRETKNNFVIFDTPGSNSASNLDHVKVLKKAMEDMSNGMPIFVSQQSALDSTDNEKLYKDIKAMEELDSRFTMIIVNKADTGNLEEESGKIGLPLSKEKLLLNMAVPKNLYGEGLFFVSSVMGLGAKTNGVFLDRHYQRVFAQNKEMLSNPDNFLYQRFYRYNIMPEQLKRKSIEDAEQQSDIVYANSGLYSVEREIQTFGNKYSAYNKCHQSERFLNKVLEITNDELQKSKEKRESVKRKLIDSLEKDKQELMEQIRTQKDHSEESYLQDYPVAMTEHVDEEIAASYQESLMDEKSEYTKIQENELGVKALKESSEQSHAAIKENFVGKIKKMVDENNYSDLKTLGSSLVDDVVDALQDRTKLSDVQRQAREKADDMIIDKLNSDYWKHSVSSLQTLSDTSKAYWDKRSDDVKAALCEIVTGSTALTQERRDKLSQIIIDYENISYDFIREDRFDKEMFKKGLFLGKISLVKSNEVNLRKLRDYYNGVMRNNIEFINQQISDSHKESFISWIDKLESTILENIVEFNPELKSQNELIKDETRLIEELESRQRTLDDYKVEISNTMVWKS